MKISYNWLKQYIDTELSPAEISEILTFTGLEVEGTETFESVKGGLQGFVIGEVKTCKKHPNADKLSVTTVDIGGDELLNIVCGAPNVAEGQKVVVATVGTTLYNGDESFQIKKAKLRGELSEGMICAEDEIGLGDSHDGIMVLDDSAKIGMPASEFFNIESDTVFEIGLTPNRIDGGSHFGVARDLAAFLNQSKPAEAFLPELEELKADNLDFPVEVIIKNEEACPRYAGVTLTGVKIGPSPEWLQNRLRAIGLHPINNVVDVTNFVLHETGQPLHAFDGDKIKGQKIIVQNLKEGTSFITLDEEKRTLSADDLIICNAEEGMAMAGIFGGLDSGVTDSTNKIFIESAYFNPVNVRKTAKRQMLSTDASFRFERGTDPNMVIYALQRAAILIRELADGSISSDIVDVYPRKIENYTVEFSFSNAIRLIGKEIEKSLIKKILFSLDINILKDEGDSMLLSVPPYRVDVQREADVVEEILRIYGYNNVEISDKLHSTLSYSEKPDRDKVADIISEYLTANGFNEMMNNSLTRAAYYDTIKTYPADKVVKLLNPLSNELNGMRQTLLFGALETIIYNINRKNADLKLFEFGNCYQLNPEKSSAGVTEKYFEENRLCMALTGKREKSNWATPERPATFFMLKSFVQRILNRLGIDTRNADENELENDLFAEGLVLSINNTALVEFGSLSPKILQQFEIEQEVYYAEFHWDQVLNLLKDHEIKYVSIPRYPEVKRDLSLLLDENVRFGKLKELAFSTEKQLLKEVSLFDVYKGKNIDPGKKSYALSFMLQDKTKTLKDKQIDKIMNNIMQVFEKELGAKVRQ